MLPLPTTYKGNQETSIFRGSSCPNFSSIFRGLRWLHGSGRTSEAFGGDEATFSRGKRVVPVEGETTQRGEGGIESLHM